MPHPPGVRFTVISILRLNRLRMRSRSIKGWCLVRRTRLPWPRGRRRFARVESAMEGTAASIGLETEPGVVMGTVAYMSPEQVKGQTADARSDIFSLGCVLYEMVAGRQPFEGKTAPERFAAILQDAPSPLPGNTGTLRPGVARHQTEGCGRAGRDRLHHLLGSRGRRLLRG